VQEQIFGASTRGELPAAAEGSSELQLSDGDLALVSRDVYVGGAGPAAGNGRKSISKSKADATKSRRKEWQAFFASLSVPDPPYTKREQNQFFKKLEAAFLSNDRDGDGSISFSELQGATKFTPSAGREGEHFREADLNRDGVLGFGEYLELEFNG
jgi:Ca2+-binding EF-hand superfamily protein